MANRARQSSTAHETATSALLGDLFIVLLAALTVAWGFAIVVGTTWIIKHIEQMTQLAG